MGPCKENHWTLGWECILIIFVRLFEWEKQKSGTLLTFISNCIQFLKIWRAWPGKSINDHNCLNSFSDYQTNPKANNISRKTAQALGSSPDISLTLRIIYVHNSSQQFVWMWPSHTQGKHTSLDHTEWPWLAELLPNVHKWNFNQFVSQKETTPNVFSKKANNAVCIVVHKKWKDLAFTSYTWLTSVSLSN